MPTRTITTGAAELFPRNTLRKSFIITNEDTTDAAFIKFEAGEANTVSTTDHDYKIGPGGVLAVNSFTDGGNRILQRLTIIAAANTPRISWFETEDIQR